MKKRTSFKYSNVYIFLGILLAIGFFTGSKYYKLQSEKTKIAITQQVNFTESLNGSTDNIFKSIKSATKVFILSLSIIGIVGNIYQIFFESFALGFLWQIIKKFPWKFKFCYFLVYHFIPLLFIVYLIKISFSITKNFVVFLTHSHNKDIKKHLKLYIKKFLLIFIFLLIYEFLVFINSRSFNKFLLSLI